MPTNTERTNRVNAKVTQAESAVVEDRPTTRRICIHSVREIFFPDFLGTLIDRFPQIETKGEILAILYVYQHSCDLRNGQSVRITWDEFCNGRKRDDGSRFDHGTSLSLNTIRDGVDLAIKHGFLIQQADMSGDLGRQSYIYRLTDAMIGERHAR